MNTKNIFLIVALVTMSSRVHAGQPFTNWDVDSRAIERPQHPVVTAISYVASLGVAAGIYKLYQIGRRAHRIYRR
jgi:hypothetical protein